jgi:uncharacterized repeat protein (TIGR01451 family)
MRSTRSGATFRRKFTAALAATTLVTGVMTLSGLTAAVAGADSCGPPPVETGPPGFSMEMPTAQCVDSSSAADSASVGSATDASYTHTPPVNPGNNITNGSGNVMRNTVIYYDFWLPTGQHYESNSAGDTAYENLLIRFANDVGGSQYTNMLTQYNGGNGSVTDSVSFGGSWVDSATAYPHLGTTGDPLTDSDIQNEVHNAVSTNGWTEDGNHIVAVFTANGIQECMGGTCTYTGGGNGFCAYHYNFSDGGHDSIYAFMAFDNFTHVANYTCVAGDTFGDNDPNRNIYPNNDVSADAEVNTFSHELGEAIVDPHPNQNGEVGDACNFNFSPRNDIGADVYLNGNPYIVQQLWSNATGTCAIDLPTNGFCPGSVSNVCAPTTMYTKVADNDSPEVDSTVTYTLTLDNTSDSAAETNLSATDSLPAGYTVTGLSAPNSTSQSNTSSSITVNYDTLAVHTTRTITVQATVPEQAGTPATNCGSLAGEDLLGTALSTEGSSCVITTPVKVGTQITNIGPASGDFSDPVTVSATLTDENSNALAGKTVGFSLNATETCSGTTDGSGVASCSITPGESAGPYTLVASYSDSSDPKYATSAASAPFTVTKEETVLTYNGATTSDFNDPATVSATLTDDSSNVLPGKTINFTLGGVDVCSGVTDVTGTASCSLTPSEMAGNYSLVASFDDTTDPHYATTSTSALFTVTLEEATASYVGPTVILQGSSGVTLSGKLLEDGVTPIAGRMLTLGLGAQSCSGTTDASGIASCSLIFTGPLGPEPLSVTFLSDGYYVSASDNSQTATVFAFPTRGAFTLGNLTAGAAGPTTKVTWWSDVWSSLNKLSGGPAPDSFKGFAGTVKLPTTTPATGCTPKWTTLPGNSPPPTSGVPSYMGVLVTSKVTKSGSDISGDVTHIVVVKVNPGYGPNPSSAGTGKIVATFC